MLILVLETALVAAGSWLLAKRYFRIFSFSESILVAFILSLAQIIIVEILFGSLNLFYLPYILTAHLVIFLFIFAWLRKKDQPLFKRPDVAFFLDGNLLIYAGSVFLVYFTVKAFCNLVNPPMHVDSLIYHLAFPAAWVKSGSLNTPYFIFGSSPIINPGSLELSAPSYFPVNGELLFAWLMLPLRNAFLADLGEAPFYLAGIIAIYAILKRHGFSRGLSLFSGLLWVLIPNIFKQLKDASQIDVMCAAMFILIYFTLLLLKERFSLKYAVLFGITAGIFAGIKFHDLVWMCAFLPIGCYILCTGFKNKRTGFFRKAMFIAAVILPVVLFGGYIYLKNYFLAGNPFFPVELKAFGKVIFKGLVDQQTYRMQMFTSDVRDFARMFGEGLGGQFYAIILPGTFLALPLFKFFKDKFQPLWEYALLFVTPLITLALAAVFVNVSIVRYYYPYLSIAFLASVIFINKLPYGDRYIRTVGLLSIIAASFELAHRYQLIVSLLFSLLVFGLLAVYKNRIKDFYNGKRMRAAALAFMAALLVFFIFFNYKYDKEEFRRYPANFSKKEAKQKDMGRAWEALNNITGVGANVAYTGRQDAYPLYGANLKNHVKYVSVNNKEITPYNSPDGKYRQIKDFAVWKKNLKDYGAEYLFVAQPAPFNRESEDPEKFPIEDDWAASDTKDFQLTFSNKLVHIYKINISE